MQVVPLEPARRLRGDDGSAIVEAAFLTPVLMFFLLGVFESAFLFLDYLTTGNAVRGGVRMGAIAGNAWDADYQILTAIRQSSAALKSGDLEMVVIYEATDQNSTVPATCAAGTAVLSATGVRGCNVYTGGAITAALNNTTVFGCAGTPAFSTAMDHYYCPTPTIRKTALNNVNNSGLGPPGWFGVYIKVRHTYITKIFGSSQVMTADMVSRFEPESLQ